MAKPKQNNKSLKNRIKENSKIATERQRKRERDRKRTRIRMRAFQT